MFPVKLVEVGLAFVDTGECRLRANLTYRISSSSSSSNNNISVNANSLNNTYIEVTLTTARSTSSYLICENCKSDVQGSISAARGEVKVYLDMRLDFQLFTDTHMEVAIRQNEDGDGLFGRASRGTEFGCHRVVVSGVAGGWWAANWALPIVLCGATIASLLICKGVMLPMVRRRQHHYRHQANCNSRSGDLGSAGSPPLFTDSQLYLLADVPSVLHVATHLEFLVAVGMLPLPYSRSFVTSSLFGRLWAWFVVPIGPIGRLMFGRSDGVPASVVNLSESVSVRGFLILDELSPLLGDGRLGWYGRGWRSLLAQMETSIEEIFAYQLTTILLGSGISAFARTLIQYLAVLLLPLIAMCAMSFTVITRHDSGVTKGVPRCGKQGPSRSQTEGGRDGSLVRWSIFTPLLTNYNKQRWAALDICVLYINVLVVGVVVGLGHRSNSAAVIVLLASQVMHTLWVAAIWPRRDLSTNGLVCTGALCRLVVVSLLVPLGLNQATLSFKTQQSIGAALIMVNWASLILLLAFVGVIRPAVAVVRWTRWTIWLRGTRRSEMKTLATAKRSPAKKLKQSWRNDFGFRVVESDGDIVLLSTQFLTSETTLSRYDMHSQTVPPSPTFDPRGSSTTICTSSGSSSTGTRGECTRYPWNYQANVRRTMVMSMCDDDGDGGDGDGGDGGNSNQGARRILAGLPRALTRHRMVARKLCLPLLKMSAIADDIDNRELTCSLPRSTISSERVRAGCARIYPAATTMNGGGAAQGPSSSSSSSSYVGVSMS
ncbi:hypothetical protein EV182_002574 [Spiromyces aspiralis]|uniref:Uncharacterized protein n=1 Tax=Spiromyces aspiralis TaxID=68401 RepID=A0ACC1HV31_9FUNG|nr:hypothetical protein EV182_002574 [Spiromyces aspiralis]